MFMDPSIPHFQLSPTFDQLSNNNDSQPTSGDSTTGEASRVHHSISESANSTPQSPRSILKSSSSGHNIASTSSEIASFKGKSTVRFANNIQEEAPREEGKTSLHHVEVVSSENPFEPILTQDRTPSADEQNLKPNKFTLQQSKQIQQWAKDILATRTENLKVATKVYNKFVAANPNLDEGSISLIKEKFSVIQDHLANAKKYKEWTAVRHSLLQGNKAVAKKLEESGFNIGSDWSFQELQQDWNLAKKEPWATHDALFDLQKTIGAAIDQNKSANNELPQQASSEQQLPQTTHINSNSEEQKSEHDKETNDSSVDETHQDHVYIPGMGTLDRHKHDIHGAEPNDNGGYTVTDMTGRRYDRLPKPSSTDSCTIS